MAESDHDDIGRHDHEPTHDRRAAGHDRPGDGDDEPGGGSRLGRGRGDVGRGDAAHGRQGDEAGRDEPGGPGHDDGPGDGDEPGGPGHDDGPGDGDEPGDDGDQLDIGPLAESDFAVRHGFVGTSPDVVVDGPLVRRARETAGLTTTDVALAMTGRGYATDAATVAALEDAAAQRMRPREARLLAALLDLPLSAVEARPVAWPAHSADVTSLQAAGVETVVLGSDVVVRTESGSYLGLLRCAGDPSLLDARTYRVVAAALLNGTWSHLAGALLVTDRPPHMALVVDALDCVTRQHAPTGRSGFSRLADPEPLAAVVAAYEQAYAITWTDPELLDDILAPTSSALRGNEGHMRPLLPRNAAAAVQSLEEQARRARQPGKQEGYEAAARWLGGLDPDDLATLLEEVAGLSPTEARARLGEVVSS